MTDVKVYSPSRVTYWFVGTGGIANINAPTPAEINAGVMLSPAVAEDGTSVGPDASEDLTDRSIIDAGNAVQAGSAAYSVTLNLFRPFDMALTADPYVITYNLFKTQHVAGYIVKRSNAPWADVAAVGDMVSVFKVMSDYTSNETAGDDAVKFKVAFLSQGALSVNTFVKSTGPVTGVATTLVLAVGAHGVLTAALDGWNITQGATWASSAPAVATVSNSGVVTGVSAGTANITAIHAAATAADTCAVTVS